MLQRNARRCCALIQHPKSCCPVAPLLQGKLSRACPPPPPHTHTHPTPPPTHLSSLGAALLASLGQGPCSGSGESLGLAASGGGSAAGREQGGQQQQQGRGSAQRRKQRRLVCTAGGLHNCHWLAAQAEAAA